MSDEDKDYSVASRAVIAKKQREIDRAQEAAEAMRNQLKKVHKTLLSDEDVKDKVRQEILNGVRGRVSQSDNLKRLKDILKGNNEGNLQDFEDDSIVGNERPYWNEDD